LEDEEESHNDIERFFEIGIENLSEGESRYIDIFSTIHWFLRTHCNNDDNITLILDEPETSFHPEWKRLFVKNITNEVKNYDKEFKIIIATHSPYLLSDILPKDAILLEKDKGNNPSIKICEKAFGSNIHDLYKNSFFMESTFGEFAKDKIKDIVSLFETKIENEKIEYIHKLEIEDKKEEIKYIINSIGEPLIRKKLENMLEEYEENKNNVDEDIKLLEEFKKLSTQQKKELLEKNSGDTNVKN